MHNNQRKKILFIVQLPPPVHGASIMNSYLINSKILNSNFNIDVVNLQFLRSIKEITKFSFRKVLKAIYYGYEITKKVIIQKPGLVYFTLSPNGLRIL